jgi:hypothetical protein
VLPLLESQNVLRSWIGKSVILGIRPEQACAAGQSMELLSNLSKAVFFDPATEKRIV